jgi:dTDP-4-dehydrorhamnose reductase
MKVLVTGANGQVGREVVAALAERGHHPVACGRAELDIADLRQCREKLLSERPDAVIHCAAYTDVDGAEADPEGAFRVNAAGTRNVASAAEQAGASFCYISTDYVFNGRARRPYQEYDLPDPQNVYGKSKLAGEQLTQTLSRRYYIVRTSWVYGRYGRNFVKTMLRLGRERKQLRVVDDQIGSPTCAADLAAFLAELIETDRYGIYHATNTGHCSWYQFAKAIFEEAGIDAVVEPCSTEQFPRPAARPAYSVLEHVAIRANGLRDLREWRAALRDCLPHLMQSE